MPLQSFFLDRLAKDHHAELLREAENWRRAKEARGDAVNSLILPRLFNWLGERAGALRQRSERWAGKSKSLGPQEQPYQDDPVPSKDCVAC
jgi:hypothetical protein